MPRKKAETEDKSLLDPLWWLKKHHSKIEELLMLTQKLTDAVARLQAAVTAVDAKVDALIASTAGLATPAEQDALAAQLQTASETLEADAQKS